MKQWVSLISLSIILVACQNSEEPNQEAQVEQLTKQVQDQNEQIEKLQQELEEKTRELQQERQDETVQENYSESNDQPTSSSDQLARTENFQLQTPREGASISDTFSIQGMIRYEAVGSVRIELIDADGNTVEETQIEDDWFTQTTNEREWTGIELNLTITSTMTPGEGKVVIHDDLAKEEATVPIKLK